MSSLNRRAFLLLATLFAPVARLFASAQRPAAAAPAAISADQFMRLSQRLVGRTTLDAQAASTYLSALLAVPGNIPLLAQLASNAGPASELSPARVALERTIIESWYTGTYTLNGERRLATHTGALMWSALGMRAPGSCATAFGAWSRPRQPSTRVARSSERPEGRSLHSLTAG